MGKGSGPVRRFHGCLDETVHILFAAFREPLFNAVQRPRNALQQIVEIVREAARQLAYSFHLLRLAQLLFQPEPFGNVMRSNRQPWPTSSYGCDWHSDGLDGRSAL